MSAIKLCRDCRHLGAFEMCYAPKNVKFDYIHGANRSINSPQFLREEGACGREAQWFAPKEGA